MKAADKSMTAASRRLYYTSSLHSAYSSGKKLTSTTKTKSKRAVKAWLLQQDSYTLHRPVRKLFPRNTYTVTNVMEVCECDLMDMHSLSNYNDKYKYLLSEIDTFSKYLHTYRSGQRELQP